jgi:hypothetical protein
MKTKNSKRQTKGVLRVGSGDLLGSGLGIKDINKNES